jgi:hypothetical protein
MGSIFLLSALLSCQRSTSPVRITSISVGLGPGNGVIEKCNSIQLAIDIRDQSGRPVTPDSVKWLSSDSTKLSVSQSGLARALNDSPGVTIRAAAYYANLQASAELVFAVTTGMAATCTLQQ